MRGNAAAPRVGGGGPKWFGGKGIEAAKKSERGVKGVSGGGRPGCLGKGGKGKE